MENSRNSCSMVARNTVNDDQEETSILHTRATEPKPTEWTDEKHSLYLKSMEATFVNQLYKSFDLIGRHSRQSGSKSLKHKETATGTPSGQFKVLQNGYWSKIDFKRDEAAEVNQEQESGVLLANPWIRHYRCSERQPVRKFHTSGAKASTNQHSTHNFRLWQQDPLGSNTEVSDQNFNDEEVGEEKSERTHEIKRTRTSSDCIVPDYDQIVPIEDTVQVDDVTWNHVHPED